MPALLFWLIIHNVVNIHINTFWQVTKSIMFFFFVLTTSPTHAAWSMLTALECALHREIHEACNSATVSDCWGCSHGLLPGPNPKSTVLVDLINGNQFTSQFTLPNCTWPWHLGATLLWTPSFGTLHADHLNVRVVQTPQPLETWYMPIQSHCFSSYSLPLSLGSFGLVSDYWWVLVSFLSFSNFCCF